MECFLSLFIGDVIAGFNLLYLLLLDPLRARFTICRMASLAIDTMGWSLTGFTSVSILATFFTSSWSAAVSFKMTITLAIIAANRVGDVYFDPDLQIANLQCFRSVGGVES